MLWSVRRTFYTGHRAHAAAARGRDQPALRDELAVLVALAQLPPLPPVAVLATVARETHLDP